MTEQMRTHVCTSGIKLHHHSKVCWVKSKNFSACWIKSKLNRYSRSCISWFSDKSVLLSSNAKTSPYQSRCLPIPLLPPHTLVFPICSTSFPCVLQWPFPPSLYFFLCLFSYAPLFPSFLFSSLKAKVNFSLTTPRLLIYTSNIFILSFQVSWSYRLPLLSAMVPSSVPCA